MLLGHGTYDPQTTPLDADGQGIPYETYAFGAQIAEVDVDLDLGTVKVRRIVAAHDVGRAINPTLVEGQIQGGIVQGLGMALMEAYVPGRTDNLHDYLIPTIGDAPAIECLLIEDAEPSRAVRGQGRRRAGARAHGPGDPGGDPRRDRRPDRPRPGDAVAGPRRDPGRARHPTRLRRTDARRRPTVVDPCVFCAIVEGTAEASFVYRDDRVVAFLDIGPVTAGHLIVVPLQHLPSLADIPEELGGHLFVVASRLAAAMRRSGLPCEGVNLFLADGEAAFQDVFHVHLHVFARWGWRRLHPRQPGLVAAEADSRRARCECGSDPRGARLSPWMQRRRAFPC